MRTCAHCGEENPDKFRFCGACGAALPEPGAQEARKFVTCVFCDVTGSTALGERLDPESIRTIMTRYFERMESVLRTHGGTVEKFIGDAVMAVFGIPEVHEDDALRAVRAAMAMKQKMAELNAELEDRYGTGIQVRTGVNTGEVLAGDPSGGQAFASGDTVNLAARLEQAAPPGEILLGAATYRLVRDAVQVESVDPLDLKGKADPVPAWKLVGVSDVRYGRSRRLTSELVGRDSELNQLLDVFDDALSTSSCRLATIVGTAGLGKTRLALEVVERVKDRALVLQGRCLSYGDGMTFWPVGEVVRGAAAISDGDSGDEAVTKIAALIPSEDAVAIARQVAGAVGFAETDGQIQEIFWAIRKLFEALARKRPLVVVFDDIHWGEPNFLDLLEYIVNFTTDAPVMLLTLTRPELFQDSPSWASSSDSVQVSLEPLTSDHSQELVRNLLDHSELPGPLRTLIEQSAEGNPLFIEELLRMLVDDGLLVAGEEGWVPAGDVHDLDIPPTIGALLASRLDRLPQAEREVIQRAGVVGVVFWWGAVTALSPPPLQPRVGTYLHELARLDFIRPESSSFFSQDAFRFGHGLIREAAYNSIPKALRAELHERFAEWVLSVAGEGGSEYDEIVGYHLEQAHRYASELGFVGDETKAVGRCAAEFLANAGRRALDKEDSPAAANLLRRAWSLRRDDPSKIPELLWDLMTALIYHGEVSVAQSTVEEARSLCPADDTLSRAYLEAAELELMLVLGSSGGIVAEIMRRVDGMVEAFRAAGDKVALRGALALRGDAYLIRYETSKAQAAFEEALAVAKESTRHEGSLRFRAVWAMAMGLTPVGAALHRCAELEKEAAGRRAVEASLIEARSALEAMRGNFEEARKLAHAHAEIMADFGLTLHLASGKAQGFATIETLAGDISAAERFERESCETLEELGDRGLLSTSEALLAHTLCRLGRWDEAIEMSARAEEHGDPDDVMTHHLWRTARAKAFARLSRNGEAIALAREAWALVEPGEMMPDKIAALMDLAEVLELSGEPDEADTRLRQALELARAKEHNVYETAILERLG